MRIDKINLSWFRGAADSAVLDCASKSLVVYGQNGTGKSSFVDAVEYAISKAGKIDHLTHEYSGTKQEKAIPNTHTPDDCCTKFSIRFKDGEECSVAIAPNGAYKRFGAVDMTVWDYRRTVLRQDEISRFIHSSKGDKYSDLLPLLGLGELEVAAENARQLARAIEQQSKLKEKRGAAGEIDRKRKLAFGDASDDDIEKKVVDLHAAYCPSSTETGTPALCVELINALDGRLNELSTENLRHATLRAIATSKLASAVAAVHVANAKLAGSVEPLVAEKLVVLESAHAYGTKLTTEDNIACPACGQQVGKDLFKAHIKAEQDRLQEIDAVFKARRAAISTLIDELKTLKSNFAETELQDWQAELRSGPLKQKLEWLEALDAESLRQSLGEGVLGEVEANSLPLIDAAETASQNAPPAVKTLSDDKSVAEAAKAVLEAKSLAAEIEKLESLVAFVNATEANVREEIRVKSEAAIADVSDDIGQMWKILHPDEPIDEVRLYLPDGDKAIDIALKFHGKGQNSPRLTLSEGYRNSLGLCIFLALAKREAPSDRPLILDDVVVSFDRNHRGMIVELLEKEFSGRQVVLLTHDRDWFAELCHQLDSKSWNFRSLLPFETPQLGIRWSGKTTNFDEARAHLKDRPDSACNDARKIMDVELSIIAEKLQLRLPYRRGDRNDHRMCNDFLERIVADGKKCFQKKDDKDYSIYADALDKLENAHKLLLTWGNKGSHSRNVTTGEASKLIEACEQALEVFKCVTCEKPVTLSEAGGPEWVQCNCGGLRWRYGKG